ncbi:MAG: Nudix family hydrolase [Burkholderiales bacterium]|nr:Nudix family hydrolase [Burkholderiales bacterium]
MSTAGPPQGARPPGGVRREAPVGGDPACRIVRVAAAVLLRPDGQVLLAQRPEGKPYAGYWEFPGGKLEPGESPRTALARELHEELGITVRRASPWLVQEFVYPHAHVELHFFRVYAWDGQLHGRDGQAFAWQVPGRWSVAPLLPANTRILAALDLPAVYAITCAEDSDEDAFLARAERALASGLRLVQLRDRTWPHARRLAFARRLVPLAHGHGARVLWNGREDDARVAGCDGAHWPAAALAEARTRPHDLLVAASCHTAAEIARAGALGLDFAVLGTVLPTPTHPDAVPLGWDGLAATIARTRLPVYALGGLTRADVEQAIDHGAHGVALRRAAWVD